MLARQHEDGSGNLGENILVLESVELQMSLRRKAGGLGVFEEINRKMPSVRKALVASLDTPSPPSTKAPLVAPRWLRGNAQ